MAAWHDDEHEVDCEHEDVYKNIQIAFLVDTTGSMMKYINMTKKIIEHVMKKFMEYYQEND